MTNRFVVFHAGVESLERYKPLMEISRNALQITNPGAEYIVLTDEETAPYLDREFQVEVLAPTGPLMLSYMIAQLKYCQQTKDGLSVLAATDCVANKSLDGSLKKRHGVAITYRNRGISRINNVAYVRDHHRMAWFLNRALGYLTEENQHWFGDQAAWEAALGPPDTWTPLDPDKPDGIRLTDLPSIYLYPCDTHNYFRKITGTTRRHTMPAEPYLVHFKGKRKEFMVETIEWCIFRGRDRDRIQLRPKKRDLYDEVRNALHIGHSKDSNDADASMFKAFRANIRRKLGKIRVPRPHRECVTVTEDIRVTETLLPLADAKEPPEDATKLKKRLIGRNVVEWPIVIAVCGDDECLVDGYRRVWYRHAVGCDTTKAYIVKYNDWSQNSKKPLSRKSSK